MNYNTELSVCVIIVGFQYVKYNGISVPPDEGYTGNYNREFSVCVLKAAFSYVSINYFN